MKRQIPLEISSTLGTIATDKPLEITPYANATGVTTEKAPVLIAVRSEGTVDADQFAARMPAVGGQGTAAQARLALNAVAAVLNDLVGEYGAITVNTPFGTVQTFVAGTVENANDAPDPEANIAFLGVVVPETYRRQFAQMSAYVPSSACPVALKRVRDKATGGKGIVGTEPFYLEGVGMTIGSDGETLELLDAVTRDKLCDIAVDPETKSPVQFQCQLVPQTALAVGDYLVRLTTLAGGETTLWPVELKVTLVEAVPEPGPVPIAESSDGVVRIFSVNDGEPLRPGEDWTLRGEGLNGADGKSIPATSWGCNLEGHYTRLSDEIEPAVDGKSARIPGSATRNLEVSDPVTPEGHGYVIGFDYGTADDRETVYVDIELAE